MARPLRPVTLALPSLALAIVGLAHPYHLTPSTAGRWTLLHVVGLFVFPLVGVALAAVVARRSDALAWLVRVAAFGYATAYTALDVIDGIGAGYVTWRLGEGVPRPHDLNFLFAVGGRLGAVGGWCLVLACLLLAVDRVARTRWRAWPAVLLIPGAVLVQHDHIFAPWGVAGLVLLSAGTFGAARTNRGAEATFRG